MLRLILLSRSNRKKSRKSSEARRYLLLYFSSCPQVLIWRVKWLKRLIT